MVKNILFKQSDFFPAAKAIKKAKVKMQKRRFFYFTEKRHILRLKKNQYEGYLNQCFKLLDFENEQSLVQ